jgi:peptidoglycan/LPS O-acetylase OafA/YrhL
MGTLNPRTKPTLRRLLIIVCVILASGEVAFGYILDAPYHYAGAAGMAILTAVLFRRWREDLREPLIRGMGQRGRRVCIAVALVLAAGNVALGCYMQGVSGGRYAGTIGTYLGAVAMVIIAGSLYSEYRKQESQRRREDFGRSQSG